VEERPFKGRVERMKFEGASAPALLFSLKRSERARVPLMPMQSAGGVLRF
jgi:hypothetical protein